MEEIRKAIAEGRIDEARELMDRLSQLMKEMGRGIRDELARRSQQGEQQQDQAGDLRRELQEIEEAQRALQSEVRALREQDSGADRAHVGALWTNS